MSVPPNTFLERRSYRRRRVVDAYRLLPLLGIWLFLVPVFWSATQAETELGSAFMYILFAWLFLITICAALKIMFDRLQADNSETDT